MIMSKKYWNILIVFIVTISIVTTSSLVYSQETGTNNQGKDKSTSLNNEIAEVSLGGKSVFEIKDQVGNLSVQERAQKISEKLKAKAQDSSIDIDSLQIEQKGNGIQIILKDDILADLQENDLKSESKSEQELAEEYLENTKLAITQYRENNEFWKGFWSLLLLIFVFCVVTWPLIFPTIKMVWLARYENYLNARKYYLNWLKKFKKKSNNNHKDNDDIELEKYKVGELDRHGNSIEYIYSLEKSPKNSQENSQQKKDTNEYVIYRTRKVILWEAPKLQSKSDEFKRNFYEIQAIVSKIISQNPEEVERVETINRLIATGIKLALENEFETSKKVLKEAENRLEGFRAIDARLQYLLGSYHALFASFFALLILRVLPDIFPQLFINIIDKFSIPQEFFVVIVCGALGGVLSVALRIKEIKIDPDSDVRIAGVSRIVIAIISSLIIYIALRANIVSPLTQFFVDNDQTPQLIDNWKIGFASVLAGFAETLVPNILSQSNSQLRKPKPLAEENIQRETNQTKSDEQ